MPALPIAEQKLWAALVPLADTPVDPAEVAGFTAITNQAGKVLIIHGTEGNDQIVIRRIGNDVRIDGFTGAINQTSLRFIAIYSYGGNDVVRLDSETHPGQETLPVPAVVHAGAGDDVIVAGAFSSHVRYDVLDGGSGTIASSTPSLFPSIRCSRPQPRSHWSSSRPSTFKRQSM